MESDTIRVELAKEEGRMLATALVVAVAAMREVDAEDDSIGWTRLRVAIRLGEATLREAGFDPGRQP